MKKVLVLCTGNSCRSIMGECLINHLGGGRFHAVSAGSAPTGYVHPKALEILASKGVETGTPKSKSWDQFTGQMFDYVITVCDNAANEACPVFLGNFEKLHWSIPDPAVCQGSEDEINQAFEDAYQMLKDRIERELVI